MQRSALIATAQAMVANDKGLLAIDESTPTCNKRFAAVGIPATEANRRAYRALLVTTSGLGEWISGIILYDETMHQKLPDGTPLVQVIRDAGMLPGIKVDLGTKDLAGHPGEKITEGLDGLRERLSTYVGMGARFAKWRAVMTLGAGLPSHECMETNAAALARYAVLCQEAGLVPIVEMEVLMAGTFTLARCREVTEQVLQTVFMQLAHQHVLLEGLILKPNMVLSGLNCPTQAGLIEVADSTIQCLLRVVPATVPGIAFLSGGQPAELASARLNMMNLRYQSRLPWAVTFSFARALQQPALDLWQGQPENVLAAQRALYHRAKCNQAARRGAYSTTLEKETPSPLPRPIRHHQPETAPFYPLRFTPIYEYRLWGGRRLGNLLATPLPNDGPIGEAWVLSDRDDHPSQIANGPLQGQTLHHVLQQWPEQMLGTLAGRFERFPVLLKYLDAHELLSLQVHPSDRQTDALPADEHGKTEAWVVLEAGPHSQIYAGLQPGTTAENLRQALTQGMVMDRLACFTPQSGDSVFLPAGTVHALGGDVLVFEIQQNSDRTFRLYDWEHVDAKTGQPRALQVDQALACIDFDQGALGPVTPLVEATTTDRRERLFDTTLFRLWRLRGTAPFTIGAAGVPRVVVCVAGAGRIAHGQTTYAVATGDVVLLPAVVGACEFRPHGAVCVLEIALPDALPTSAG